MANKFKAGEVVVMKSGGPPITIDKVPGDMQNDYSQKLCTEYHCEWFKGAVSQRGSFSEHLLEKYVPPTK